MNTETRNGWLTPDGAFFPAEESPPVSMEGLTLGGHAMAALDWLEKHHTDWYEQLHIERRKAGLMTWEEHGGETLIKNFMARKGFKRVADE